MGENAISTKRFRYLLQLPLKEKIHYAECAINEWYEFWEGKVCVSYSGGKDSSVLLHLVRSVFPDCPGVFADTGLEYPEIRSHVKKTDNIYWVRPKKSFEQIVQEYGWPVVSKKVSTGLDRIRVTNSEVQKHLRMFGGINPSSGKKQEPNISKKWHFLLNAPFKCSERCCYYLKKHPMSSFHKKHKLVPFVGTKVADSDRRRILYLKTGCNAFKQSSPMSKPLSIWSQQDIDEYISTNKIEISSIYQQEERTGCMYCLFGIHKEKAPNRFQRMKISHPKHYEYIINKLGAGEVLDFIGIPY